MSVATVPRVAVSRRKTQPFSLDASVVLRPSLTNEIDDALGCSAPNDPTVVLLYQRYARPAKPARYEGAITALMAFGIGALLLLASVACMLSDTSPIAAP